MYGAGRVLTCSVCGLPLNPEEARKCRVCGRHVCRDHIRYHPLHGWVCTSCMRRMAEPQRRAEKLLIGVAYVEL
ncbi:MAG: hypothetical protein GXO00_00505 [Candidatus Diapherotrites archaeon]|nr:hypothetical protein [Candidatus Diapherotrites archaeon]